MLKIEPTNQQFSLTSSGRADDARWSSRLAADAFVDFIKVEVGTFCRLWLVYLNVCCALAWTKPQDDHRVKSGPLAEGVPRKPKQTA